MKHKTFELIEAKAEGDAGQFTALASVFGNVDLVGDRMMPGSFSKTLENWRASGDPIPVILSHQWDDPMALIGKADPRAVYESDQGLVVQGQLDMDNPVAKQVHKLMKDRLLKGWSFGYTVPQGGQKMKDGVNEVTQVDLIEVGPTLKGANPEARLEAVKAALHEEVAEEPTIPEFEMAAAKAGDLKAVWTTAFINNLPDSSFLYIEDGGSKDGEGKTTPRSLRHFPYKDDSGSVDLPHLRNALSRIPQSNLPQDVKDRLTQRAQKILDNSKSAVEETDEVPTEHKSRSQDALRRRGEEVAFALEADGIKPRKEPPPAEPPKPSLTLKELRQRSADQMLNVLAE